MAGTHTDTLTYFIKFDDYYKIDSGSGPQSGTSDAMVVMLFYDEFSQHKLILGHHVNAVVKDVYGPAITTNGVRAVGILKSITLKFTDIDNAIKFKLSYNGTTAWFAGANA